MTFTQVPQNYASLFQPLRYRFEGEGEPRTLRIEVWDMTHNALIHTKELHATTSGEIDISPLLRRRLAPQPKSSAVGFLEEDLERWITVQVRLEGASVERTFMLSQGESPYSLVVGNFSDERQINYGECEELTLMGNISKAQVEITTPEGVTHEELVPPTLGVMPRLFRIDTRRFPQRTLSFSLTFYIDGMPIKRLKYHVLHSRKQGRRVAWIDRKGALQHYTFPLVGAQRERQQRTTIEGQDGRLHFLTTTYEREMMLVSNYEAQEVRKALSELGTAQSAWLLSSSEEYLPIEARLEGECNLSLVEPMCFVIRPTRKELSLWSC